MRSLDLALTVPKAAQSSQTSLTAVSRLITQRPEYAPNGTLRQLCTPFGHQRSFHGSRRAFSSSFEHSFPSSSPPVFYPRWLNQTKQNKATADARRTSHDRIETAEPEQSAKKEDVSLKDSQDEPPASSSGASSSSAPPSSDGSDDNGSNNVPPSSSDGAPPESSAISKLSVPEVYPQLLALPIARRPLFPGFYKAVVVRDPAVVAAMKDMLARGQPYLGAFLLKAGEGDSDTITDINSVHKTGVFAQITSVFPASGSKDDKDGSLTVVLYPHRRIKINELLPPRNKDSVSTVQVDEVEPKEETQEAETVTPSSTSCESNDSSDCIIHTEIPQSLYRRNSYTIMPFLLLMWRTSSHSLSTRTITTSVP
jgi:Lon-like ATP-dependent protease